MTAGSDASWLKRALLPLATMVRLAGSRSRGTRSPLLTVLATGAVTVACTLLAFLLSQTTPARYAENLFYDLRIAMAARPATSPIVIVKIDDAALAQMRDSSECRCLSPIDKAWLADLVAAIGAGQPSAIGIDYMLDVWRDPAEYAGFSAKLSALASPIIAVAPPLSRPGTDFSAPSALTYADARALIKDDYDDVVRSYDPLPDGRQSFARAIATALGVEAPVRSMPLAFRSPIAGAGSENRGALVPAVSASIVRDLPPEFFAGKTVLIGRVTRSADQESPDLIEDMHATPLRFLQGHHDGTPGVEVHAHALDQMIRGDVLRSTGWAFMLPFALAAALAGCVFGRSALRWWATALVVVSSLLAVMIASVVVLWALGLMVGLTAPTLSFALAYFITGRITTTQLRADRALYAGTLERYLAPQVIERIVEGGEPVEIGASAREITVLASDIADFSVLVGATEPALFSRLINGYFDGVIDILWRYEAMLDKLTGDGLIAIFGAPVEQPDHARRALDCALAIDQFSEAYRTAVASEHAISFGQTRIGIHTGPALVGNFGGERRFNYTAYGETVVIAARLEAANKSSGTRILASRETINRAGDYPKTRLIGDIELKGVVGAVGAFTIDQ